MVHAEPTSCLLENNLEAGLRDTNLCTACFQKGRIGTKKQSLDNFCQQSGKEEEAGMRDGRLPTEAHSSLMCHCFLFLTSHVLVKSPPRWAPTGAGGFLSLAACVTFRCHLHINLE